MLLYIGGVGGTGKSHLIRSFIYGMKILGREEEILLTASTGAAAAAIQGQTYHSALGMGIGTSSGKIQPSLRVKGFVQGKRAFLIDEVSMVSDRDLSCMDDQSTKLWGSAIDSEVIMGGVPLVVFFGDFKQFSPVTARPLWKTHDRSNRNLKMSAGREKWMRFDNVMFLTEQKRQADDLEFQGMLSRARSAALTDEDVMVLNAHTVRNRIANGETPPDIEIERENVKREAQNRRKLEVFARSRGQRIYLFPAKTYPPSSDKLRYHRKMLRVGEVGAWKGAGFLPYSKGMPTVLLDNVMTSKKLVNGTKGTTEGVAVAMEDSGRSSSTQVRQSRPRLTK